MYDYQLFQLIKPVVDAALTAASINTDGFGMTQSYSKTPQGVTENIQVFCQKLDMDKRYGWPLRLEVWNTETSLYDLVERQLYESTFQMGAFVLMNPKNLSQLSGSDILKIVSGVLSSEKTIEAFNLQSVGILRITEIRVTFFKNDKDNWQQSPSFDFTLTHKQDTITATPQADPIQGGLYPV